MYQQTITKSFTMEGVGIHTGAPAKITVHPAEANTGRVFRVGKVTIPAQAEYVVDTRRCTTLGNDGARVMTVEHLLSAMVGLSVDNAVIEVEGPEIPILDGSAVLFARALIRAGIVDLDVPAKVLFLSEPCTVDEGESSLSVPILLKRHQEEIPFCRYTVSTEFTNWPEGNVTLEYLLTEGASDFREEVAPARTFAFQQEVDALIAAGLAKGGSLDNALVITPPDGFSSPIRMPNEWAVHKMLDLIGDLALVDARLRCMITAIRPGHTINTRFARLLREKAGLIAAGL